MLYWLSFWVGVVCCPASAICLGFICARPKPWARFTEAEDSFCVRRGLPVTWAGACRKAGQGPTMKLVVAALVFFSALAIIAPFVAARLHS